ncbi:MAG: hypothetical protein ACYCS8_08040 [Acidithiobacillus sp.]
MAAVFLGLAAFLPDKSFESVSGAMMISLTVLIFHGSSLGWCVLPVPAVFWRVMLYKAMNWGCEDALRLASCIGLPMQYTGVASS